MHELLLNILVGCIGIAILVAIGKASLRLIGAVFKLIAAVAKALFSDHEPSPDAVEILRGKIVDARNWHATNGRFYAEFWIKTNDGKEQRYKLSGTHPEVRKGHRVTLYEYASNLIAIINHSTGTERWVAPGWLLSSLYPTGRRRKLALSALALTIAYFTLKPFDTPFQEALLFVVLVISALLTLKMLIAHFLSGHERQSERINKLSALCSQATKTG